MKLSLRDDISSNKFKDYIKRNLLLSIIKLIIIILVVFIAFMIIDFKVVIVKTNESYNNAFSNFVNSQYQEYKSNIERLSQEKAVQKLLSDGIGISDVNNLLYTYANKQKIRACFALLNKNGEIISSNFYKNNQSILQESSFTKYLIDSITRSPNMTYDYINKLKFDNGQDSTLCFAKAIVSDKNEVIGYVFIFLKTDDLKQFAKDRDTDIVIVTDKYNNVIFSTDNLIVDKMGKFVLNNPSNKVSFKKILTLNGRVYFLVCNASRINDLKIFTMTSIIKYVEFFIYGTLFLLLASTVMMILAFLISDKIVEKNLCAFDSFVYAVNQCKNGNINYRIESRTFDEFQELYSEFNNMMQKIQVLIKNNNEIAERKRVMEIKHLESKFNPHFVFNVLETLRYEIFFDPKKAEEMVMSLANIMRYNLKYGDTEIELKTDIEYIKAYLALQKMRYNSRLNYEIIIDEEILNYRVPKLVFQPLVENSIKHGIEKTNCLKITIVVKKLENDILITVKDNGGGIEAEKLCDIRKSFEDDTPPSEHTGLYNVNKIIKLVYGENYGLFIDSNYGTGTLATIRIPLREESGINV